VVFTVRNGRAEFDIHSRLLISKRTSFQLENVIDRAHDRTLLSCILLLYTTRRRGRTTYGHVVEKHYRVCVCVYVRVQSE